jgi:hypothetical protein
VRFTAPTGLASCVGDSEARAWSYVMSGKSAISELRRGQTVAAWETTMITRLLTAELTVLIILCFVGLDYRH